MPTSSSLLKIDDIHARIITLLDKPQACPLSANKGKPGILLEQLTGIPQTSNCLDCSDGEVKTVPIIRNKAGKLVPKETVAVTMLNKDDLRSTEFGSSKCFTKLKRVLVVPYIRTADTVQYLKPILLDASEDKYADLYANLAKDYNSIRDQFVNENILHSKNGVYLQNRTKGAGHGSKSRAFYLRKKFVEEYVPLSL
jgi:DNA mismatch repair protein MutH